MAVDDFIKPGDVYVMNMMSRPVRQVPELGRTASISFLVMKDEHFVVLSVCGQHGKAVPDRGKYFLLIAAPTGVGWMWCERYEVEMSHFDRLIEASV